MSTLGDAIAVLGTPETIRERLENLGKFHGRYKLEKIQFEVRYDK